jgi:hypothetical protein
LCIIERASEFCGAASGRAVTGHLGWTEAHQIAAWSRGGATDLANGCLLCSFHHHLLHKGEGAVRMAADGIPEVLPPHRIDPTRTPIRHQRFWASATHTPGGPQP